MARKFLYTAGMLLALFTYVSCSEEDLPVAPSQNTVAPPKTTNQDATTAVTFQKLPYEDATNGRNSYAYNPAVGHPTTAEKTDFINTVKPLAQNAQTSYQVPACVLGGMAVQESGYGFTRSGYFANNLFGLKYWNPNDPSGVNSGVSTWQLKGQPDEAWDGSVVVTTSYGTDRKVFKEAPRYDNRYRAFSSYAAAINYLAGTTLQNSKYKPALTRYINNINNGWPVRDAALQYVYDIAEAGYNHKGGTYYRNTIGAVMDAHDMYGWNSASSTGTDTSAPTVNITAPANGATVSGNVTISANASDNIGVSKVEFYSSNGTYLISTDNTSPYSINWATAGYVGDGSQTLMAKAYDAAGNTQTHSITVTVSNGSGGAPATLAQATDNTALTLTTGGSSNWYADNSTYYSGTSSARSGAITHSQNNYMQFTASGPKTLSFYWKVSSEQYYDYLELWIDGVKQNSITGSTAWAYQSWWLTSGSHTIKFVYRKDGATSSGSDAGWVDSIKVE